MLTLVALATTALQAQWLDFRVPGTPRLKDGTPNLSAPAPRALDGHPDLSGVWMHEYTTHAEMKRLFGESADIEDKVSGAGMERDTISKYGIDILADFFPNHAALLKPETAAMMQRRGRGPQFGDAPAGGGAQGGPGGPPRGDAPSGGGPVLCSGATGIPQAGLLTEPFKIIQSPQLTAILYESDDTHRQIYTDGRSLPLEYTFPAYMGYSVGHWEKDTLVVETAGFNDKTRMDIVGHPRSDQMQITERYYRRDFGHLEIESTYDDPKYYAKPFTVKIRYNLLADLDIFENFCTENEKDREHLGKR